MNRWWIPAAAAFALAISAAGLAAPPSIRGLYDADPNHLWNRVHRQLHIRTAAGVEYGDDEVDPLLWDNTKYLLTSPSHENALRVLDQFLNEGGERLVRDPLKRAVFQHDLWAVFDWAVANLDDHPAERRALAARLAKIMRRVALKKEEIDRLPDNYAAAIRQRTFSARFDPAAPARAYLPPDLLDAHGPWLRLTHSFTEPLAPSHAGASSRSDFSVLLNVPGGAGATETYLKALWDFAEPFAVEPFRDGEQRVTLNPALPQFPVGTQVALARTMLLVDADGHLARSRVTESLQLRFFHGPFDRPPDAGGFRGDQAFFEFRTERRALFGGGSGFHALDRAEKAFVLFSTQGVDGFESTPPSSGAGLVLESCHFCHPGPGIQSLQVARRLLKPNARLDFRHPRWSVYAQPSIEAKLRRRDWGMLQALW